MFYVSNLNESDPEQIQDRNHKVDYFLNFICPIFLVFTIPI
jgi:hypothetical protein